MRPPRKSCFHGANADLMAAAPDLLAACEQVRVWISQPETMPDGVDPEILAALDTAIAKATGAV